jgi:hypothetical protein
MVTREHETRADLHRRWTTVLDGELKDWVGVSDAPLADFERGIVHGRRVDADAHCVPDCPGQHA